MSVKVKIKKITDDPDFIYPSYAHDGDSGMDVYSLEDIWLPEGSTHLFKLGFEVEFPKGYEIQVRSKSGLALKEGLVVLNSPGTVDCVPYGTQIETLSGKISVESLLKEDATNLILSYNEEENKIEEDMIEDVWEVNGVNMIRIETDESFVEIPSLKQVFTKRGWVEAENLKVDDEILSFK
jgi:dUTP pyrophosphatase